MIMPALPKTFHFATTFGEEWNDFWDGLWQRAESAIASADELVVIGYSLPTADERARAMLLGSANKAVRLSICCGKATASLKQEFRDRGFSRIEAVAPTFDGFLTRETAGGGTDGGAPVVPERRVDGRGNESALSFDQGMTMEPQIESKDKSEPFSVRLSDNRETIGELREPSGRPRRFSICKLENSGVFVVKKPSVFGGVNHIFATQLQTRGLLRADLPEHDVDQMMDFAIENPLNGSA